MEHFEHDFRIVRRYLHSVKVPSAISFLSLSFSLSGELKSEETRSVRQATRRIRRYQRRKSAKGWEDTPKNPPCAGGEYSVFGKRKSSTASR